MGVRDPKVDIGIGRTGDFGQPGRISRAGVAQDRLARQVPAYVTSGAAGAGCSSSAGRSGLVETHKARSDMTVTPTRNAFRPSTTRSAYHSPAKCSEYRNGKSTWVSAAQPTRHQATARWLLDRTVRHAAPRASTHTRYCGLSTRLVTTISRVAASAASYGTAGRQRARSRHTS